MVRIILAVIVGFLAWSILWVGSDSVLRALSPDWYGAHQYGLEKAMTNTTPFPVDQTILIISLIRSIIISLMAGFLTAVIAGENRRSTFWLGILLFLFGGFVQAMTWNYIPVWYHLLFLGLLIPATILGGWLKRPADAVAADPVE